VDEDLLEQVARLIGAEPRIHRFKGHSAYTLHVGGTDMGEDLIALGCVPAKSRILEWPEVPDKCISHSLGTAIPTPIG